MGNLTKKLFYRGSDTSFETKEGLFLIKQVYSERNDVLVAGRNKKTLLDITLSVESFFETLQEEEKTRFVKFFYDVAPEYLLETVIDYPPIAVDDTQPTGMIMIVNKIIQNTYGVWTIYWRLAGIIPSFIPDPGEIRSPSWDFPPDILRTFKKTVGQAKLQHEVWDKDWEI